MTAFFRLNFFFLVFAGASLLFSSCSAKLNKRLAWHEAELTRAANSNMSTGEKLDILLTSFVKMADETLKPINPKTGVKYVKRYTATNKASIDKILKEVDAWQNNMSDVKRLTTGVGLARKPYTKKLIELYPKFRRKYKQYKFALQLTDSISGGLGKLGGKILKGL